MPVGPPLKEEFFARNTVEVARELLGCFLVYFASGEDSPAGGRIVETEAYLGSHDPACHSSRGRTKRNEAMFCSPGHAYIYFIYGMHLCLNVTTDSPEVPAAVLLRALEPTWGLAAMKSRRKVEKRRDLCRGPGRLVQALGLSMELNGSSMTAGSLAFFHGPLQPGESVVAAPRIGISRAADWPLRFYLAGNPFVSHPPLPTKAQQEAAGQAPN